jgi:DNA-directed RNA polymerase subunit M/transcription elongation factor TFIIS
MFVATAMAEFGGGAETAAVSSGESPPANDEVVIGGAAAPTNDSAPEAATFMQFCKRCQGVMSRDPQGDDIIFKCRFCGEERKGDVWDTCVEGGVIGHEQTGEMYRNLLKHSPFDPVNQRVARLCKAPGCGLDYMTLVRVGLDETVVFRCECGVTEYGAGEQKKK